MRIAEQSSGDLRAAINDLDSLGNKIEKGDEKIERIEIQKNQYLTL